MENKKLPTSVRYLNYAKAVGATVSATIAISAFVIATWYPPEPMARAGYQATEKTVAQLSQDLRQSFEGQTLTNARVDVLREQMTLMLATLHAHMMATPPAAVRRPRRPLRRPASARPRSAPEDNAEELPEPPAKPASVLLKAALQQQEQDIAQADDTKLQQALLEPPQRALPSLQQIQKQVQEE